MEITILPGVSELIKEKKLDHRNGEIFFFTFSRNPLALLRYYFVSPVIIIRERRKKQKKTRKQ